MLKWLSVFAFGAIFQNAQIAAVAALADARFLHSLAHGASGLVGVGAIGETAIVRGGKNFFKIVRHFGFFKIDGAEPLHPRGVDNGAATGQIKHFAESGGVHTGVVTFRYVAHAQPGIRHESIDERTLPYPGITAEEGGVVGEHGFERINAFACEGRQF